MNVYLAADTTAAWIGLIGVFVGGLITTAANFGLERLRAGRQYRQAVRLARAEVADMLRIVDDALTNKKWPPGLATKNWAQSWSTYRRDLAGKMDDETFRALSTAYGFAEQVQSGLASGERAFIDRGDQPESDDAIFFGQVCDALKEALHRLG